MCTYRFFIRPLCLACVLVVIQGCTTATRFEGAAPGTRFSLREFEVVELPKDMVLESKATGQYEFMATTPSCDALYGILPLRVNGGTMAASIALFAPALFIGGFRDVFAFYQLDPVEGVVRYKNKAEDDWRRYKPTSAESERAKRYFDSLGTQCNPREMPIRP